MKRVVIFLLSCCAGAALCWLGGYDFNSRGIGIALTAAYIIGMSAWISAYPFED